MKLDSAIKVEDVSVSFGAEAILHDVNLEITEGECLVIVGPSGQGKTVLLKTLAGLITPQAGVVSVKNQNLATLTNAERLVLLKQMGMLFQKNALFDSFTCGENVAFPLRETTSDSEISIQTKVEQFLEAVGLGHTRNLYPDEISGGMQKRLGIARALALRPAILFYDDPTAGLDPITSRKIIELILRLRAEDRSTVIAVTNDMNRAWQMADRIAFVHGSDVLVTGTPDETRAHPDPRVQQFIRGDVAGPLTAVGEG